MRHLWQWIKKRLLPRPRAPRRGLEWYETWNVVWFRVDPETHELMRFFMRTGSYDFEHVYRAFRDRAFDLGHKVDDCQFVMFGKGRYDWVFVEEITGSHRWTRVIDRMFRDREGVYQ